MSKKSTFCGIYRPQKHSASVVLFGNWNAEPPLPSRNIIVLCLLLGALVGGSLTRRHFSSHQQLSESVTPIIDKQAIVFATHTFDPAAAPPDMPPLSSAEIAECDSDFRSNASVRGEIRQTDATHATVTISQIRVKLELSINIWLPIGVTQRVTEHEEGHRQISEYYYQNADKLAERIATRYMGRQVDIGGADLNAESSKALQQMAAEITAEYNKEIDTGPAQHLYDTITDHGRNEAVVKDAVAHALKNVTVEWAQPATNPGN